ncbi:uncharacterized protein MONBRDRAFT_33280 [Monosiga brevicollis MX1]|uniref:Uncharacterized protein n=1 Tax=Monosiga brevicollis TaxID=81824 RepID=A9V4I6_MONBE|nr:uncharacterized protein MONBRDRAFT_33280 [Monosiga brevicollis MX1]EDQ87718.1 predicted protein [Monosiga brevicollis MX1]|eukprot:XP_001747638.1 hypothetical protein [Monosiga brevicollis MX1]
MEFSTLLATAVCCLVALGQAAGVSEQLSDPRLLLPLSEAALPIRYNLTASNGCYAWSSMRPDLIQVTGEEGECARQAEVLVVASHLQRNGVSVPVVAANQKSGQVLRCEVELAPVHRTELITVDRTIYLEEPPESLSLRGYDSEGNMFSSLSGLAFEWRIMDENCTQESSAVLTTIAYSQSPYDAPAHISQLQGENQQGDRILVVPLAAGRACVQAVLKHTTVASPPVVLTVVERTWLEPIMAHLAVQQKLHLQAYRGYDKQALVLSRTGPYQLAIDNTTVLKLQGQQTVLGETEGRAVVTLRDKAGLMLERALPTTFVSVHTPTTLTIQVGTCSVLAMSPCVLLRGHKYPVQLRLLSGQQEILLDGLTFQLNIGDGKIKLGSSSKNTSWYEVTAATAGITTLKASYHGPEGAQSSQALLTASRNVQILHPIDIQPKQMIVPFSANARPLTVRFKASGGSGEYTWSTNATAGKAPKLQDGSFTITDTAGHAFRQCRHMPSHWSLDQSHFTVLKQGADANSDDRCPAAACSCVVLRATSAGSVLATFASDSLTATAHIAAYAALAVEPSLVELTPGTTFNFHYLGGPSPADAAARETAVQRDILGTGAVGLEWQFAHGPEFTLQAGTQLGCHKLNLTLHSLDNGQGPRDVAPFTVCVTTPRNVSFELGAVRSPSCPEQPWFFFEGTRHHIRLVPVAHYRPAYDNSSSLEYSWHKASQHLVSRAAQPGEYDLDFARADDRQLHLSLLVDAPRHPRCFTRTVSMQVVKPIALQPSSVPMLLQDNVLEQVTITGGSGYFKAESQPATLANIATKGATLGVRPLQEGTGLLDVDDICTLPAASVTAQMTAYGIKAIEIYGPEVLQVGGTAPYHACVRTTTNTYLSAKELQLVDLQVEARHLVRVQRLENLPIERVALSPTSSCFGLRFNVTGIAFGDASFRLLRPKEGAQAAVAARFAIQVFAPLSVDPAHLRMIPSSCAVAHIEGGPKGPQFQTRVTADRQGHVTHRLEGDRIVVCARELGSVRLQIAAHDTSKAPLTSTVLDVSVVAIDGIRLRILTPEVLLDTTQQIEAELLLGDAVVHGASVLNFSWSSTANGVQLRNILGQSQAAQQEYTRVLYAARVSQSSVSATLACKKPYCTATAPRLVASQPVTVVPRLSFTETELVLSYGAAYDLALPAALRGHNMSFTIAPKTPAMPTVDAHGRLVATSARWTGSLGVETITGGIHQSAYLPLRVVALHHVSMLPSPNCSALAVGQSCQVALVLHDSSGRRFTTTNGIHIQTRVNGDAQVAAEVEGNFLALRAFTSGHATIEVVARSHGTVSHHATLTVVVRDTLRPSAPVLVPAQGVCFEHPDGKLQRPRWESSNTTVLALQSEGCFVAQQTGTAVAAVAVDQFLFNTMVTVSPLTAVEAVVPVGEVLSQSHTSVSVPVTPWTAQGAASNFGGRAAAQVTCHVEGEARGSAVTKMVVEEEGFTCVVQLHVQSTPLYLPSGVVSVVVQAQPLDQRDAGVRHQVDVPFAARLMLDAPMHQKHRHQATRVLLFGVTDIRLVDLSVDGVVIASEARRSTPALRKWSLGGVRVKEYGRVPATGAVSLDVLMTGPEHEEDRNLTLCFQHRQTEQRVQSTDDAEPVAMERVEASSPAAPPPAYNQGATPAPMVTVVLPSYDEVQQMKQRDSPVEQQAVLVNATQVPVNGMLLGDDLTFVCTFMVAFFLSWLGYLFTLCMGQTIAARTGGLAGFGLHMVKLAFLLQYVHRHHEDLADDDQNAGVELTDEQGHQLPPYHSWIVLTLGILGFLLFVRGVTAYGKAKAAPLPYRLGNLMEPTRDYRQSSWSAVAAVNQV